MLKATELRSLILKTCGKGYSPFVRDDGAIRAESGIV
jgi:hypothetical protein